MKNKIILGIILIVIMFCFCGCNNSIAETNKKFIYVSSEVSFDVYYEKETKIMYAVSNGQYNKGNVTLLVNPDGTPLLYDE